MTTPQEKAEELVDKYIQTNGNSFFAKQCALIAVDEILIVCNNEISHCSDKTYFYWEQVKKEIELL